QEGDTGIVQAPAKFSVCLSCHTFNGFENATTLTGIDAPATFGPDLTMLVCRETFAAGLMETTPENLKQWLLDPGAVKPENYMATQIGPGKPIELTDEEAEEFVDFLYSMAPEGGCLAPDGWNAQADGGAAPEATPADDVEATPAA